MARRSRKQSGGYSYTFVDEVPEDYKCPVCLLVLRDPELTECCCYNLCQSCSRQVQLSRGPCPRCKTARVHSVKNRQLRNDIGSLAIRCVYVGNGCTWTGALDNLEGHLNEGQEKGECQFAVARCALGCGQTLQRHCFQQHQTTECSRRLDECAYCGIRASHDDITGHHKTCTKYPITCPKGCGDTFGRCHLSKHQDECPLEEVQCELRFAGCNTVVKRQDLQCHMDNDTQRHISLLARELMEQQRSNETLKRKYEEIQEELEELSGRADDIEAEVDEVREDQQAKFAELDDTKRRCDGIECDLSDLEGKCRQTKWWY